MKVCIDAGHGGSDPGAVDPIEKDQDDGVYEDVLYTKESRINLRASIMLRDLLSNKHDVVMTREDNNYVTLSDRADMANQVNADIFISLHANAALRKSAHGIETLYYPTSENGKKLAQLVQNELISASGAYDRGVKPRENLYVLRKTKMPAILVEIGFITNPREEHLLNQNEYLHMLMKSVEKGVEKYG